MGGNDDRSPLFPRLLDLLFGIHLCSLEGSFRRFYSPFRLFLIYSTSCVHHPCVSMRTILYINFNLQKDWYFVLVRIIIDHV